jgi:hypothetical protein
VQISVFFRGNPINVDIPIQLLIAEKQSKSEMLQYIICSSFTLVPARKLEALDAKWQEID